MDFTMALRMKIESEDNPDIVQLTFRDPANLGVTINLSTNHDTAGSLRVGRLYKFDVTEIPKPAALAADEQNAPQI